MEFFDKIAEKWALLCEAVGPVLASVGRFLKRTWEILLMIWEYIVRLRKIFLSIPVVIAAVELALTNMERLPKTVGWDLQTDGTFAVEVARELACWAPVLLTLVCLVLMFCSKRVLTPWLVSVLTLLIPIFIWVTNVFPA